MTAAPLSVLPALLPGPLRRVAPVSLRVSLSPQPRWCGGERENRSHPTTQPPREAPGLGTIGRRNRRSPARRRPPENGEEGTAKRRRGRRLRGSIAPLAVDDVEERIIRQVATEVLDEERFCRGNQIGISACRKMRREEKIRRLLQLCPR